MLYTEERVVRANFAGRPFCSIRPLCHILLDPTSQTSSHPQTENPACLSIIMHSELHILRPSIIRSAAVGFQTLTNFPVLLPGIVELYRILLSEARNSISTSTSSKTNAVFSTSSPLMLSAQHPAISGSLYTYVELPQMANTYTSAV